MMNGFDFSYAGAGVSTWVHDFGPTFFLLVLWTFFWKGLALWHSARRKQPWWFVIFLFVNVAGLLEIIYLFLIIKLEPSQLFSKKS